MDIGRIGLLSTEHTTPYLGSRAVAIDVRKVYRTSTELTEGAMTHKSRPGEAQAQQGGRSRGGTRRDDRPGERHGVRRAGEHKGGDSSRTKALGRRAKGLG